MIEMIPTTATTGMRSPFRKANSLRPFTLRVRCEGAYAAQSTFAWHVA